MSSQLIISLVCLTLAAAAAEPAPAPAVADAMTTVASEALLKTTVGGGVGGTDGQAQGSLFAVHPLWSTIGEGRTLAGSMIYIEPFMNWQEGGQIGASLVLGFRHLYSDQTAEALDQPSAPGFLAEGWYYGGSLGVDCLQTAADNWFWQFGTGVEIGSRYLTFRANYYVPLSGAQQTGSATRFVGREITTQRRDNYSFSVTPIPGRTDISDTRFKNSFRSTTTIRDTFEYFRFYEEPLEGWDVTMTALVPKLDEKVDVRLFTGLYGFDGGEHSESFTGWRAGMEVRPIPALVLGATWFDDDRYRQGHWFAGARVEIPLGVSLKEIRQSKPHHLVERLTEPTTTSRRVTVGEGVDVTQRTFVSAIVTNGRESIPIQVDRFQLENGFTFSTPDGRVFRVSKDGMVTLVGNGPPWSGIITIVAVPEPSRCVLFGLGLIAVICRRRRVGFARC